MKVEDLESYSVNCRDSSRRRFTANWSLLAWRENVLKCSENAHKERDNHYHCVNNICTSHAPVSKPMRTRSLKINTARAYNGSWTCPSWHGREFQLSADPVRWEKNNSFMKHLRGEIDNKNFGNHQLRVSFHCPTRLAPVKNGDVQVHNFIECSCQFFKSITLERNFFQAVTMREVVCWSVTFLLPTNRLETINPFIKIH